MSEITNKECGNDFMTITINDKIAFDMDTNTDELSVIRASGRTTTLSHKTNSVGRKIFKALYNA
jgi:hypothetical protein